MAVSGSLWKSTQLWRLGQLIQDTASGVARSILVINRSLFSLHSGTYTVYRMMNHSPPPGLSLRHLRRLFPQQSVDFNSSISYKDSRCYIFSKYVDHCGLMMDFNLLHPASHSDSAVINYKVIACCSNTLSKHVHSQTHRRLMSDILPVSHSDARNGTGCEQTRSAPMNTVEELVEFLQDENAHDICVIQVPPHLDYVDYFVVCSGFGGRHLRRMADGLVTEVGHNRLSVKPNVLLPGWCSLALYTA